MSSQTALFNTLNTNNISESNGKHYSFSAVFAGIDEGDDSKLKDFILNNSAINSFSWVNEANNILLTGELEYTDVSGDISKFYGSYISYVMIRLEKTKNVLKSDNTDYKKEIFEHLFIVNNFEILSRSGSIVVYKLHLVSAHWFDWVANIEYSTHEISSSSGSRKNVIEKTKDIFHIMSDILNIAFDKNSYVTCDTRSFISRQPSNISLDYCTTVNTTCDSAIKYLQNCMIMNKQDKISSLNFLVLDEFNKKIRLMSLGNDDSTLENNIIPSSKLGSFVALFGSDSEQYMQNGEQNFRSVVKRSNCLGIKSFFPQVFWEYDPERNVMNSSILTSDELINIGINNNFVKMSDSVTDSKYVPIYNSKMFFSGSYRNNNIVRNAEYLDANRSKNYYRSGTADNENFSNYNDLLENITNRNSLILETAGEITHQPGQLFSIADDSDIIRNIQEVDEKQLVDKFRMLRGVFYIFKVRHIFIPGDSDGISFYERLFISRTHNKKITI